MLDNIPTFSGELRKNTVTVPAIVNSCSEIRVFGQLLKSFLFATDVAIIRKTNADAISCTPPSTRELLKVITDRYRNE